MLLERLHLPFAVASPDIDESPLASEQPQATALRLALEKSRAVARQHPGALVIGSDQIAVLDGLPIGKPGNHENAVAQLRAMRGKTVAFHTALCLLDTSTATHQIDDVPTTVRFRELSDAQIEHYLRREQPYDCAGSAKIESLGITLAESVQSSDPTALIGLPLIALTTMLQRAGVDVLAP